MAGLWRRISCSDFFFLLSNVHPVGAPEFDFKVIIGGYNHAHFKFGRTRTIFVGTQAVIRQESAAQSSGETLVFVTAWFRRSLPVGTVEVVE